MKSTPVTPRKVSKHFTDSDTNNRLTTKHLLRTPNSSRSEKAHTLPKDVKNAAMKSPLTDGNGYAHTR